MTEPASALAPPPGLEDYVSPESELPDAALPSRGSVYHATGECRPCSWFWKPAGCLNGAECGHCHACPQGEIKARKKQRTAMLRLGLTTPKAVSRREEPRNVLPFGMTVDMEQLADRAQDQDESTTCSGSDHDNTMSFTSPSPAALLPPVDTLLDPITVFAPELLAMPATVQLEAPEEARRSSTEQDEPVKLHFGLAERLDILPPEYPVDKHLSEASGRRSVAADVSATMNVDATDEFPSQGSLLHGTGTCRPCAWFWKAGGCRNAKECLHCHLCPEGELKARKKSRHAAIRQGTYDSASPITHSASPSLPGMPC